jgi:hypothetical protein
MDDIRAAIKTLEALPKPEPMPVIVANNMTDMLCMDRPRMELSEKVPVTAAFRAEINAWMREFFGVHDVAIAFDDPITGRKMIAMSQRAASDAMKKLRAAGQDGGK